MHGSWDMECDRIFFVICDCFFLFYPPNNPENQNFEKMKNPCGDIIILHMCTINDYHMMHVSWDRECNRQNFLSFWTIFANRKNSILKKWKKRTSVPLMIITWCMVPEIMSLMDKYFLSFLTVFCSFTPLTTQKIKLLKKMKKLPGDIVILHMCTINDNNMMYVSWNMECDRQTFLSF